MSVNHKSPAELVIERLGGVSKVARLLGQDYSSVLRWPRPKDQKGAEGKVPTHAQRTILDYARANGLDLTAEDLIYGRNSVD